MLDAASGAHKVNWQDAWRSDLDSCSSEKADLFLTSQGKARTRRLSEMGKLIADKITAEQKRKQAATKPKGRPKDNKKTKKERMRQEMSEHLTGVFKEILSSEDSEMQDEYQGLLSTGENFVSQMMATAKLAPDTEVTLREWCDLAWRTHKASPLDQQDKSATEL